MLKTDALAADIWNAVRDDLPASKREEAAEAILRAFQDHGAEANDLAGLRDEDEAMASAYESVFGEEIRDALREEEGY